MGRWVWGVLHAAAAVSLVAGAIPFVWILLSGTSDPRTNLGGWAIILHMRETHELVIRPPGGTPRILRYHDVAGVFQGYLVLYVAAWVVRLVVARAAEERVARRVARGLCGNCGYDLRGTSGRCPECGTNRSRGPRAKSE